GHARLEEQGPAERDALGRDRVLGRARIAWQRLEQGLRALKQRSVHVIVCGNRSGQSHDDADGCGEYARHFPHDLLPVRTNRLSQRGFEGKQFRYSNRITKTEKLNAKAAKLEERTQKNAAINTCVSESFGNANDSLRVLPLRLCLPFLRSLRFAVRFCVSQFGFAPEGPFSTSGNTACASVSGDRLHRCR